MPVSGITSPARTLIPMAGHPTFPQSHAASCPLWDWTSWMENKWALSPAHSTSYNVCRFFNLTMPVKPKQDPEQCTQLTSQEMTGFSSVSHMPCCTVTDISYTPFDRHKLISLRNCRMRPYWQPSGETGPKQWCRLKSQKMWFHRCANVYPNCRKTCMTVSTSINSWLCNTNLHLNPTNSSGFHFCASTSRICLYNCPWCPLETR